MKSKTKKFAGFTLIELLVAIVIIGILTTITINTFRGNFKKARDVKRLTQTKQLQKALELYYIDHEAYPYAGEGLISNCGDAIHFAKWKTLMTSLKKYPIDNLPLDAGGWPLCIYYLKGGYRHCDAIANTGYVLIFSTESTTFPDLDLYNIQGENGTKARYCLYSGNNN
jgi:type II secretion system protein G